MEKITILRGPDRVRKRPAVVFGSADGTGAQKAVSMILDLFSIEAQLGYCKYLSVIQDGDALEISGHGRGIYLGDKNRWHDIFCEIYCAPMTLPEDQRNLSPLEDPHHHALFAPGETEHLELCSVQYVSRYMQVISVREHQQTTLRFEKGYSIGESVCDTADEPDGTTFRFALDPEVFSSTEIPADYLRDILDSLANQVPGLVCEYRNIQDNENLRFFYE